MRLLYLAVFSSVLVLTGCATSPEKKLTPLEVQSIQTRSFESPKEVVFASVMSVLQDSGYIIGSADEKTGFITANSAATSDEASKFWFGMTKVSQTSATAFVETIGKSTRVRLNFVVSNKSSTAYGQTDRQDKPILDAKVYNNAFEKIENAIFVRSGNKS